MNTTIQYSLLRILLFLASLLVLWLVGLKNPLWLLLAAATVSMLLSLFLLSGLRERMSADVVQRVESRQAKKAARRESAPLDEDIEDAEVGRRERPTPSASTERPGRSTPAEDPDAFR
ncbi:DUF4229 domain-containing protein [Mobilicoccus caccae]|uniref:DUF4229 domain-containing protein n=1 Tax=Mobilicoccus caccae TaxID=1859295 RepID=A0ABQ6IMM9_9MICO|nr:DUF4229 domain-containing protein [Mobilicoccus caccae]GMA38447.1 hypothetical protein GCM10025883_04920 [Mobilicoccus caccae]